MTENGVERWADEYLGVPVGDAKREDVLSALREHVLQMVILAVENVRGEVVMHLLGHLVPADRDPDAWELADRFAVTRPGARRDRAAEFRRFVYSSRIRFRHERHDPTITLLHARFQI